MKKRQLVFCQFLHIFPITLPRFQSPKWDKPTKTMPARQIVQDCVPIANPPRIGTTRFGCGTKAVDGLIFKYFPSLPSTRALLTLC